MRHFLWVFTLLGFLSSCSPIPNTESYANFYQHLQTAPQTQPVFSQNSPYFIVFLVNARHLDYTDNRSFFKTIAKHPSDGTKNGDVGHAWIFLQGKVDGKLVFIEGGHTGETGCLQAKYFDGIMNNIDFGYASPTCDQLLNPRYEPNPIKYLWEIQEDGFFQWGSGHHRPSYAAGIELTEDQFFRVLSYIQSYNYQDYALIGNQCSSFLAQVAAIIGLDLECEVTIPISSDVHVGGSLLRLWNDPYYSQLTIATPDVLERSLMKAVEEGHLGNAIEWYSHTHEQSLITEFSKIKENILLFPRRLKRYSQL